MRVLSGGDLKKYLFNVRDLEASCYKQNQYINYLSRQLKAAKNPKRNQKESLKSYDYEWTGGGIFGLAIFIALVGLILFGVFGLSNHMPSLGIWGALIGGGIGFLIGMGRRSSERRRIDAKNAEIQEKNAKAERENQAILVNANRRAELLRSELDRAVRTLKETERTLSSYYIEGVVYSKYRGFVPITMFCEYFASGRCSELTGPNGAYNIYENEIRLNLILVKLDDIISRLDQIQENQYMLAGLLQDCNREIRNLTPIVSAQAASLARIEERAEVSSYYNRITASNTTYLSWLAYLNQGSKQ